MPYRGFGAQPEPVRQTFLAFCLVEKRGRDANVSAIDLPLECASLITVEIKPDLRTFVRSMLASLFQAADPLGPQSLTLSLLPSAINLRLIPSLSPRLIFEYDDGLMPLVFLLAPG